MLNKYNSIIITGASGGIGKALCKHFQEKGWFVIATSRKKPKESYSDAFVEADLNEMVKSTNFSNDFRNEVLSLSKNNPIKSLINNAAVQVLGQTENLTTSDMILSFNVNVIAPFLLTKMFSKSLLANKGSVLNIGTVHARSTKPGFTAYATSKNALHGLTRSLALDLAPNVRVNTLAPGATLTPMLQAGFKEDEKLFIKLKEIQPLKRISSTREVAKAALFLCSDDSSFMTGTTIYCDGGILAKLADPC
jgi:NAD(P)-dependent dehydrogenase (short-subunit alcohol dehydrogenase family)